MFNLIDIGVNLMSPAFNRDRDAVLARAKSSGVQTLIITGSSIEDSVAACNFAKTHPDCAATAGVHPHNAKVWDKPALAGLSELFLNDRTIAAVGECGLDYNRNFSPADAQRKCFEEQLALAVQIGKPVFLHERDAFGDFVSILKKYRAGLPGAVVHCFTGSVAELEAYLSLDCYIGITGWICDERRGAHLVPLLKQIPAGRLLLETDAPYLLPRNLPPALRKKSGRNEPCFLPHIAAYAAAITDKTPEQLAAETTANAQRLFTLSLRV